MCVFLFWDHTYENFFHAKADKHRKNGKRQKRQKSKQKMNATEKKVRITNCSSEKFALEKV